MNQFFMDNRSKNWIKLANHFGRYNIPFVFLIDFNFMRPFIKKVSDIDHSEILYDFNGFTNCFCEDNLLKSRVEIKSYPIAFSKYKAAFNYIQQNQYEGNSYLANLTFPIRIELNNTLKEIFYSSFAKYKVWYKVNCEAREDPLGGKVNCEAREDPLGGKVNCEAREDPLGGKVNCEAREDPLGGKVNFIVFSPETFIRIEDGIISSYPMKGTIDASIKNAKNLILTNEKETAEHATIVDLIRNDLNMVANNVCVEKYRYIDKIITNQKNLLQVSSKIVGRLQKDYWSSIGDIIVKLLPAGSVTGAPKKKTVEIIKHAEQYERGFYCGVGGYFDGSKLDSGVMIRFIENINGEYYYKSGGGITIYSDVESEYKELNDKIYVPIN